MVRTMIQLTEEQMKALKALAKARKTSVAKLVREGVAQYIVNAPVEISQEEKRKKALEFLEWVKKEKPRDIEGATDVSINHDKYLAEIYGTWKSS